MIKLAFSFLLFCVAVGAIISVFVFIIDVIKWHDKEEKVVVVPSANDDCEEVIEYERDTETSNGDVEHGGERSSSAFLFPRS